MVRSLARHNPAARATIPHRLPLAQLFFARVRDDHPVPVAHEGVGDRGLSARLVVGRQLRRAQIERGDAIGGMVSYAVEAAEEGTLAKPRADLLLGRHFFFNGGARASR